ncbi:hypothetical protein GF324_02685, partial [bacterium]|nr:hypothetical protein [bacterium]
MARKRRRPRNTHREDVFFPSRPRGSMEVRFVLDAAGVVLLLFAALPYLGAGFLPQLEWLSDNQVFRLLLPPAFLALALVNGIGFRRRSRLLMGLLVCALTIVEAAVHIPFHDVEVDPDDDTQLSVLTLNCGTKPLSGVREAILRDSVELVLLQEVPVSGVNDLLG